MDSAMEHEFFRQLALLLKANLPLPESIRHLAGSLRSGAFRRSLEAMGEEAGAGLPLAEAMRRTPRAFAPEYIRLVEAGEKSGTLPETLAELGQAAYFKLRLADLCREAFAYPVLLFFCTILLCGGVLVGVMVPACRVIIAQNALRTSEWGIFCLALAETAGQYWREGAIVLAVLALFCVWLGTGGRYATRTLLAILPWLPGFRGVFSALFQARFCFFAGLLLGRKTPGDELAGMLALCLGDSAGRAEMIAVKHKLARGMSLPDALETVSALSPLIIAVFRNLPEERIPTELTRLSQVFLRRAATLRQEAVVMWEILAVILAGGLCIAAAVLLMLPWQILLWEV